MKRKHYQASQPGYSANHPPAVTVLAYPQTTQRSCIRGFGELTCNASVMIVLFNRSNVGRREIPDLWWATAVVDPSLPIPIRALLEDSDQRSFSERQAILVVHVFEVVHRIHLQKEYMLEKYSISEPAYNTSLGNPTSRRAFRHLHFGEIEDSSWARTKARNQHRRTAKHQLGNVLNFQRHYCVNAMLSSGDV